MTFAQRMMLSMLAILLLCAIVNGVLVYTIVNGSNKESVEKYSEILLQNEKDLIDSWLSIAESAIIPYVTLSNQNPDSMETYKARVLKLLKEIRWNANGNNNGYYFVFGARTGGALLFRDSLGKFVPQGQNVLDMKDFEGKKFVREIRDSAFSSYRNSKRSDSVTSFKYTRLCPECAPSEKIAKGILINDWDWIVATGTFSHEMQERNNAFARGFSERRLFLMQSLFGVMLISFLAGLFLVFRQMNSFTTPLKTLSTYLHGLASEGIRFDEFKLPDGSQQELQQFATDISSVVRNVGKSMEEVHINADRVSDLSGACADMLDIVDYDAKLVGQRTSEMREYSRDVVDNINYIAAGIGQINSNLDGLKTLTSRIADGSSDIKTSVSQMSDAMRELNEISKAVQNSVIFMVQVMGDMGLSSVEELKKIGSISDFAFNLADTFSEMSDKTSALRLSTSQSINFLNTAAEFFEPYQKEKIKSVSDSISLCVEELYNKMINIQTQLSNLQDNQIVPLQLVVEERRNLSKEMAKDANELNTSIEDTASRISEINSNSQYINSSIKFVTSDIDEAYHKLKEIVNATDTMNENAHAVSIKMNEFSEKSKRVEDAHEAIAHTISEAKVSMKNLNDLSANLRKVVDNLMRIENKNAVRGTD